MRWRCSAPSTSSSTPIFPPPADGMLEDAGATLVIRPGDRPSTQARSTPSTPGSRSGDAPAYLLFTSGSTGRTKGVLVGHRAIDNRLAWMQHHPAGPGRPGAPQDADLLRRVRLGAVLAAPGRGRRRHRRARRAPRPARQVPTSSSPRAPTCSTSCRRCCGRCSRTRARSALPQAGWPRRHQGGEASHPTWSRAPRAGSACRRSTSTGRRRPPSTSALGLRTRGRRRAHRQAGVEHVLLRPRRRPPAGSDRRGRRAVARRRPAGRRIRRQARPDRRAVRRDRLRPPLPHGRPGRVATWTARCVTSAESTTRSRSRPARRTGEVEVATLTGVSG